MPGLALPAAIACVAALLASPPPVDAAPAVSGVRAKAIVRKIASLGPRVAGSANERKAGRIVAERLRKLGYEVVVQKVRLPGGGASRNVVGLSNGPVRAVVVAHLDGVAGTPAANDNASGVAVMLEIARALEGERGLLVAAVGAEERRETGAAVTLGSARLMRDFSRSERRRIRVAISLDMVGVGTRLQIRGLERSPNRSARAALRAARRLDIAARYVRDVRGQSDHAVMTRRGLPAAWIYRSWDACWHRPCDRPSRVKASNLKRAARVTAAAVRTALSG